MKINFNPKRLLFLFSCCVLLFETSASSPKLMKNDGETAIEQNSSSSTASDGGHCIWYGECYFSKKGNKNCNYTGPAKPLLDEDALQTIKNMCFDLVGSELLLKYHYAGFWGKKNSCMFQKTKLLHFCVATAIKFERWLKVSPSLNNCCLVVHLAWEISPNFGVNQRAVRNSPTSFVWPILNEISSPTERVGFTLMKSIISLRTRSPTVYSIRVSTY